PHVQRGRPPDRRRAPLRPRRRGSHSLPVPPLSPEEAQWAEKRIAAQLQSFGAAPGDACFRVPERKPPLAGLFFDRAGRLWVRRSVAQGQPSEADVYSADGKLFARVTWPARIWLDDGFVGLDRALGITTDSLGVVRVALLEFAPAAGSENR